MTQVAYTTTGDVRGRCGHRHKSLRTATACLLRDQAACCRLGGGAYSDRQVVRLAADGSTEGLSHAEWRTSDAYLDGELSLRKGASRC